MGPVLSFYAALVGFFSFAAIYHFILWMSSRREILLAVYSAECALLAALSVVLVKILTVQTTEAAQAAMEVRNSIGALVNVMFLWNMSLVSGVRARWFVWSLTGAFLLTFVVQTFSVNLDLRVLSVEQFTMPWGEVISRPIVAPLRLWKLPFLALIFANFGFCLFCCYQVWRKQRFIGSLMLLAGGGMILNIVFEILRIKGKVAYPAFGGVIVLVFWVCVIAVLIASERRQTRDQLVESRQRFRGIFDQTVQFMELVKTDGTLIMANRTALEFAGIHEQDVIGRRFWEMPWWSHSSELQERLRQAVKDAARGKVVRFEATRHRLDGTTAFVDFSLKPVEQERGEIHLLIAEGHDITGRKQAEDTIRKISRQLITIQENERRHLARELHDEIGQVLTAIKMNLRCTIQKADAGLGPYLEENLQMVDQAIGQVRNLSLSLRPPQLDELGLVAALHWLVKYQARVGEFQEHLEVDMGNTQIESELETVCFRIAQEALTNAVRHAKPRNVEVKLRASDSELYLSIHDDGIGFEVDASHELAMGGHSLGLIGMQERTNLAGGKIEIESHPGRGTSIHARFPLPKLSLADSA